MIPVTYSPEQINNRKSDYICWDCGIPFQTEKQKQQKSIVTAHNGNCGLCNEVKGVTYIKLFNYLKYKQDYE